jgi:chromosome segregation ATPase
VTQRTAANLTSLTQQHTALHETVKANQTQLAAGIGTVVNNQQRIQTGIGDLCQANEGLAGGIASITAKHDTLSATLQNNNKQLTDRLTALASSDRQLASDIINVHTLLQRMTNDLSASEQHLQAGIDALSGKADQTVAELANTRSSLQETLKVGRDVLTGQMAASLQGQQALQGEVRDLGDKADKLTTNVGEVATQQNVLHEAVRANQDAVITALAGLSDSNGALRRSVDTLDGKTDRVAGNLTSVAAQQQSLYEAVKTNHDVVAAKLADVATATGQTARDVAALNNGQAELQQSVKAGQVVLTARAAELAGNQQALKSGIDHLGQATQRVASDMARMADGQQQMQGGLDILTATAGQTALDVIAMTARQDAIRTALQSHEEASGAQMAKLADSQQQMQDSLDTVTATTGQASLDTLALHNGQGQLGQVVSAGRQETAAKLTALAQEQQNWSGRLDTAQAKVAAIADSLAALEQQIAKLQGVLQASTQGTTALLGTTAQQRLQFETKVSQDIQAVIDSLAQLRQTQTSLQEQITQVQRSTQGQAEGIRSIIEQTRPTPSATERAREPEQAPAEIKISTAVEKTRVPAPVEPRVESSK